MAGKSADFDQNNASSFNFKLMFVNFNDGSLYPDVDLRKYGLESGKIVTNAMVQELCSIHPKIETLNLTHCSSVTDVGLWAIAKHLSLLRILNCYGCNGITTVGLRSLSLGCSNILELDLSFCPLVDDVTLTVIAGGSWKIEKLSVEGCEKISDNGICKLAQGLGKSLTFLNLNRCPCIGEFGDRGLKELGPNCPNLVELYISNSKRVEDAGLSAIALGCLKLKKLSLAGCENITKKSLKLLTTNLINLQDLKIIKNRKLVDMDYSLLAGPKASNNFRTIDSFTASALLSPSLKQLTILRLSQFETLTDKGVAIICATLAQQIRVLNLIECCLLTDYATFIIGQYCPELRELDLSYCKHFSDQCIVNMANKLKVLTLLKLDGNPKISTPCLLKYISNDSFEFVSMANNWLGYQPKPFVEKLIEQKRNLIIFHEKATKIQSIIRRKFADKIYLMKYREHLINKCIPMVQSIVRGYLQRKKYRKVLALKRKLVNVIKIQNQFRKYSATKKRKILKKQKLFREYCHRLATIIQRFYRGHKGRVKVKKIRIDQANEILYKAQLEAQLEVQSIKIQRVYRGYKARCLAYQLYESRLQQMFRHRLEVKMRRIIQRVIRGKLGRIRAEKRRQEIAFYQYQWLCARNLQRVYRGHLGRLRFQYFLNLSIQRKRNFAATQIQRIYRGYRGKLLGAIAKSLRLLREKHQFYALEIQRFLRGCMGRHYFKLQKDIILQHKYREQAAIQIQRVFRGHKGREFREIEKAMQQMEGQAKPLMDHLRKCEKEAEEMRKLVKRLESMEQLLHKELFEIERELEHCMLTTNKYSDSSRINQTPQRFLTKFLRIRLKDHLEHEIEVHRVKYLEVQAKRAELRDVETDMKYTKRELEPLTTGLIADVKRKRTKYLRDMIHTRRQAATKIQSIWRRALVRSALYDPYKEGWIQRVDKRKSDKPYYLNTISKEVTWTKPLAYWFFGERTVSAMDSLNLQTGSKSFDDFDQTRGSGRLSRQGTSRQSTRQSFIQQHVNSVRGSFMATPTPDEVEGSFSPSTKNNKAVSFRGSSLKSMGRFDSFKSFA